MKLELLIFVLTVFILLGVIVWFTMAGLPELTEYNDRLAAIQANLEKCNCSDVCAHSATLQYGGS
jgi:hypothetical protein